MYNQDKIGELGIIRTLLEIMKSYSFSRCLFGHVSYHVLISHAEQEGRIGSSNYIIT